MCRNCIATGRPGIIVRAASRNNDLLHRAFGVVKDSSWEDFQEFLKSRCFPPTRGNVKEELRALGLTDYDPLQIVEKTHGRTAEDRLWLKFRYYPAEKYLYGGKAL